MVQHTVVKNTGSGVRMLDCGPHATLTGAGQGRAGDLGTFLNTSASVASAVDKNNKEP